MKKSEPETQPILTPKDIAWMRATLERMELRAKADISQIGDWVESCSHWLDVIGRTTPKEELTLEDLQELLKPKPKARKPRQVKDSTPTIANACFDHPKYGAKRAPRTDCAGCWQAYKYYNPNTYAANRKKFERTQRNVSVA